MSSRGKNFRRRSGDDASDDHPMATTPKPPPRPKSKPLKLLSFADDEEDDGANYTPSSRPSSRPSGKQPPFSSSSSSSVHKLSSSKDRAAPKTPLPSNVQPQAGEYTRERLRELQKNARPLGSAPKPQLLSATSVVEETVVKVPKSEAVIVLKGLIKPVQEKEENKDVVEEEDAVEEKRFAKLGIDGKGKDSSLIPDQATIAAIRAKRERMRQTRAAAPDYISLDGGGVASTRASSAGGSSDDEESDFRGRISLVADESKKNKGGVFEVVEERVMMEERSVIDDDEEERIWEEEQFRKGLGKRFEETGRVSGNGVPVVPAVQAQPAPYAYQAVTSSISSMGAGFGVSRSAEILSIPEQAEVAKRALQESISRLKESHNRTVSSLVRTDDNLNEALTNITHLEKSLEAAGKKFLYVQELKIFISIMCDFLQDKAPFIEELEEQMQKLHEDRAAAIVERRAADFSDEMAGVEAAVNAAMSVLSKGSGSSYFAAATSAAQTASAAAKESLNLPVELDEFGRDMNLQKRLDSARRAEARKRRKAHSEAKSFSAKGDAVSPFVEGECSTDESDSEVDAYLSSQNELLQTAEEIFSDAADEYSNLSVVKQRFEEWKKLYVSSYHDAYMAISAPDIFSPYVRLELLKWDPLHVDLDFNDMNWHTLLFDYGMQMNQSSNAPDDPDNNLVPELVEKIALPILHHQIANCWDIFSTKRTQNVVSATRLIINYIPPTSEALQDLLSLVRTRLIEAVANLVVPTWSTTIIKIVPDAAPIAAYRFGVAVRLLRNVCLWKDILAPQVLEKIAIDGLLSGKILPHLHNAMANIYDAITRTERVVASLTGIWSGTKGEQCPRLQPLVECVSELGRKLEKRHSLGAGGDSVGLARRLKKLMVDLNEYDKARAILRTFQIKEAL